MCIRDRTGSAKSTLVSLISRLYDVDRGSVIVGGEDVRKYDLEVLRNEVAAVSYTHLTSVQVRLK